MKTFKIKNEIFYYEELIDAEDEANYTYSLYDKNRKYIASAIMNFRGMREIAKTFLTGDEELLQQAINYYCY